MKAFEKLVEIIAQLRDPKAGCPWDIKQTHQSLKTYLLEEAYEVLDAIDNNPKDLREELGDLLLQIMLHSQIASESGDFSIEEVITDLNEKLIHRHPHVFGDVLVSGADEVASNWQKLKHATKKHRVSILDGLPKTLPALSYAFKLGERCQKVNFDWEAAGSVFEKLLEECEELGEHVEENTIASDAAAEELGDVLFTAAQMARKMGKDPEGLLRQACKKFETRFRLMEKVSKRPLDELRHQELETLWSKAKEGTKKVERT